MNDTDKSGVNKPLALPESDRGWYLYALAWRGHPVDSDPTGLAGMDGGEQLQSFCYGDLAAFVSRVPLAEFAPQALSRKLQDSTWLEARVRGHERVVGALHRQSTIVPVKFGCVFSTPQAVAAAIEQLYDQIEDQLRRLEGCEEWGVHLYADRPAVQQQLAMTHPEAVHLQQELALCSPGRAYLLQRKLTQVLAGATEEALTGAAQRGFDHLAEFAVAAELIRSTKPSDSTMEVEVLRASYLVRQPTAKAFAEETFRFVETQTGLRGELSGPWPPYTFAGLDQREVR